MVVLIKEETAMKKIKQLLAAALAATLAVFCALPAFAAGDDDLVMSNCDSTAYWSANSQGADALESDTANKTEGSGSVGATAVGGKLNQIAYIPDQPVDVSKYSFLEFDVYFSDLTWFSDCGSVMIELTSSGTCDKESNRYMKKTIRSFLENGVVEGKENWWHFVLELDNPQGTANGQLNKSNFNYFRFYTVDPITTTPDYTMRFDNMRFTNNPENYTPMEEEEEDSATASEAAKPVQITREDPNAAVVKNLHTLVLIEGIALGVIGLVALVLAGWLIIGKIRKAKGESGHE